MIHNYSVFNPTNYPTVRKVFLQNCEKMRENWMEFCEVTHDYDDFIKKSTLHRNTVQGRAADELWWMIAGKYDEIRAQWDKEIIDLWNSCFTFQITSNIGCLLGSRVMQQPMMEQLEYFEKSFEFFERWAKLLDEYTRRHTVIVSSTLHALDMALV